VLSTTPAVLPRVFLPVGESRPHLTHGFLGSAPQTACRSVKRFLHSTSVWPPHRQTHRPRYMWHLSQLAASMLCMRWVQSPDSVRRDWRSPFIVVLSSEQATRERGIWRWSEMPRHSRICLEFAASSARTRQWNTIWRHMASMDVKRYVSAVFAAFVVSKSAQN